MKQLNTPKHRTKPTKLAISPNLRAIALSCVTVFGRVATTHFKSIEALGSYKRFISNRLSHLFPFKLRRPLSWIFIALLMQAAGSQFVNAQERNEEIKVQPKKNWTAQISQIDASGAASQYPDSPYSNYDADLYENLDYNEEGAARTDLSEITGGIDRDWVYISIEMAEGWSSASQNIRVAVELEINQSGRGDFLVRTFMLSEYDDKEKWQDAGNVGSYTLHEDANNDVGGSDPNAPDSNPGDGYESDLGQGDETVFARVMGDGNFEIAISRIELDLTDAYYFAIRSWSAQLGNELSPQNFTFHDHIPIMDIGNIDSYPGANTDTWIPVTDIEDDAVDIAVTQTVDLPNSREGDTVVITTTASHIFGTSTAEGLEIELELPSGLTLVSVDEGSGVWDDKKDKWILSNLNPGAQASFSVSATIDSERKGTEIDVVATLTKIRQDDINAGNNAGTSTVFVVGWTGEISFVADLSGAPLVSAIPGADLFVQVADPDENLDSTVIELVSVTLTSLEARDSETLQLTETDAASGVFIGSIPTRIRDTPLVNDGHLQVTFNDTVTTVYIDKLDSEFNFNTARSDTLTYEQSAPSITLLKFADKSNATPGEVITYRVDYFNNGAGTANSLDVQELIPDFTNYVAGSMRAATLGSGYGNALPLTDADDGNEGQVNGVDVAGHFNGTQIQISVARVDPDDGSSGSGTDSGTLFFQVQIQ